MQTILVNAKNINKNIRAQKTGKSNPLQLSAVYSGLGISAPNFIVNISFISASRRNAFK